MRIQGKVITIVVEKLQEVIKEQRLITGALIK